MSTDLTDPKSLRNDQYKDSSNLSARANLHQHYSTNPDEWQNWVFEQFQFQENCRILELGCGPGYLWQQNLELVPLDWEIVLTDLSTGMLGECRTALASPEAFSYIGLDAQEIPFSEAVFDAVIANHMLYHLPDIPAALKEIRRVLKPAGCLYAATNGPAHLKEIRAWKSQFFPDLTNSSWGTPTLGFSLENGNDLLHSDFADVKLIEYPDRLEVDQVDPIMLYIQSYTKLENTDKRIDEFRNYLQKQINEFGSIRITKEGGLFIAAKR